MQLYKIAFDLRHPIAIRAISDRNDMHRIIFSCFGKDALYQVLPAKYACEVVVLSPSDANRTELTKNGLTVISSSNWDVLPNTYREGCVLKFHLTAYPSKKVPMEGHTYSVRRPLKTESERRTWMEQQGAKYGFELLDYVETNTQAKFNVGRKTGEFQVNAIDMNGILRITNAESFWQALANGIGPEKAYGCGLLLPYR